MDRFLTIKNIFLIYEIYISEKLTLNQLVKSVHYYSKLLASVKNILK